MLDEPPEPIILEAPEAGEVEPLLPMQERADGSIVIDLSSLAPQPTECLDREPDPFNPEIVVCREVTVSARLGADYGPTADELLEGSAVPRARVQLSGDAAAEANAINQSVGGWNANGGEVRARIKF